MEAGTSVETTMVAELFKLVMPLTVSISITSNSAACETEAQRKIIQIKIFLIDTISMSLTARNV